MYIINEISLFVKRGDEKSNGFFRCIQFARIRYGCFSLWAGSIACAGRAILNIGAGSRSLLHICKPFYRLGEAFDGLVGIAMLDGIADAVLDMSL